LNSRLRRDARGCIACHSPVGYILSKGSVATREDVDPEMSGVTCDFCHTIEGYRHDSPGNGNYISVPGEQKLGPLYYGQSLSWHRRYSELHTKSEFCAICHNQVNRHGLEIKATFSEWKESPYQEKRIECQDCHMNVQGFLTAGEPVYQSGQAAQTSLADPPYRPEIYTHEFHGAHSRRQVVGALTLKIEVEETAVSAGDEIGLSVFVDKAGKQTLSSYNATKIILDNRLSAAEIREETYHFRVPENAKGRLLLFADLYYFPYPGSFAQRLGLPKADGVVIASTKKTISLE
jgi:hypothetical protein